MCCMDMLPRTLLVLLAYSLQISGDTEEMPPPAPELGMECLKGPYHREYASVEEAEFTECTSWRQSACCNVSVVEEIKQYRIDSLYGDSWDLCGELSSECERYYVYEECFYQCEPHLGPYNIAGTLGEVRDIPICSSYCSDWFNACKHDLICVENVLVDYDWGSGSNACPVNSTCMTFAEMYGDAKGICDKMWGDAFYYVDDSTDNNDFCMTMLFDGDLPNPNNPDHTRWETSSSDLGKSSTCLVYGMMTVCASLWRMWIH